MATVVQVKLKKRDENTEFTTWVDKKKNLAVGALINLKEDKETWWEVLEMYGEADSKTLHPNWKVGGL